MFHPELGRKAPGPTAAHDAEFTQSYRLWSGTRPATVEPSPPSMGEGFGMGVWPRRRRTVHDRGALNVSGSQAKAGFFLSCAPPQTAWTHPQPCPSPIEGEGFPFM